METFLILFLLLITTVYIFYPLFEEDKDEGNSKNR